MSRADTHMVPSLHEEALETVNNKAIFAGELERIRFWTA